MTKTDQKQPIFSLDKIYLKDVSLEVPNAPKVFLNREQPNIELNINYATDKIDEGVYQTNLKAAVKAVAGSEQMFIIEIEQCAIFQLKNIPEEQLTLLQNVECPNMIFPYLREAISDLTTRAGFLPVFLAPINFMALYQQKLQAQSQAASNSIN